MLRRLTALLLLPCAALAQMPDEGNGHDWVEAVQYEDFHVVVPENPSPEMNAAADAFCRYWKQATRRTITASAVNVGKVNVWLGADIITKDMLKPEELEGLSPQGCLIRTYTPGIRYASKGAQKQLLIAGTTDQATLYGVYTFMERAFAARWLAPGVTRVVPAAFTMRTMELRSDPAFAFREAALFLQWKGPDAVEFRRGLRLPAAIAPPPPGVDALAALAAPAGAPPDNTAEYGSEAGAAHIADAIAELVRAANTDDAKLKARRGHAEWPPGSNTWSLNGLDWLAPAASAESAQRDAQQGSPAASVLFTANQVAGRLAALFPDAPPQVLVILPPALRRPPQTLRPAEGVVVMLSAADRDFALPMEDPANAAFAGDLRGWSRLGGRLWVLAQAANPRDPALPFPNLRTIQPDILFCAQNGVSGMYALGGAAPDAAPADLAEMRACLWTRMLWNPDAGFEDMFSEYCDLYYGPAGTAVRECVALEEAALKASGKPLQSDDTAAWLDAGTAKSIVEKIDAALTLPNAAPQFKPRLEAFLAGIRHAPALSVPPESTPAK